MNTSVRLFRRSSASTPTVGVSWTSTSSANSSNALVTSAAQSGSGIRLLPDHFGAFRYPRGGTKRPPIQQKLDRLDEAFLFAQSIDIDTYDRHA